MARMTPEQKRMLEMAETNHIWLNAFSCIRPTPEFLQAVGQQVLDMLNNKENLIPARGEVGSKLAELTPCLYLHINKS